MKNLRMSFLSVSFLSIFSASSALASFSPLFYCVPEERGSGLEYVSIESVRSPGGDEYVIGIGRTGPRGNIETEELGAFATEDMDTGDTGFDSQDVRYSLVFGNSGSVSFIDRGQRPVASVAVACEMER